MLIFYAASMYLALLFPLFKELAINVTRKIKKSRRHCLKGIASRPPPGSDGYQVSTKPDEPDDWWK